MKIQIYLNIRLFFTLYHTTDERMSEYIRTNKFDTNEFPNIFVKEKLIRTNVRIYIRDQYIRIFEYSNIFVTLWSESSCSAGGEPAQDEPDSL